MPVVFALLASSTTVLSWGNSQARAGFVVSGQSDGVAISSNLTIASLASANISLNPLQGSAPAPYNLNLTNSLGGNFSAGTYNLPVLGTQEVLLSGSTGLLTTTANSNIDGVSNSGMVSGSTAINNLNLKVLSTLLVPVLTINATTLTTASSASGTYGSLTASGTPTITGLAISVLGINVTALVEASAGALVDVSALTGLTGLKIGIDLTTIAGDGIAAKSITTDNIVVQFTNVSTLGGGSINGSLTIGESQALITASPVPEPASVAMMGVGLVLAGIARARRSRRSEGRLATS